MLDPSLDKRGPLEGTLQSVESDPSALREATLPSLPPTAESSRPARRYKRALDNIPSPAEELQLDHQVRNLLNVINFDSKIAKVPDEAALIQARPHQIFEILDYIRESQRRDLVSAFLDLGLSSRKSCSYVLSNLAPAVTPLSPSERVDLLEHLYAKPASPQRTDLMVGILRLSRNIRQLSAVVTQFGDAPLEEMKSAKLNEFVAAAKYGTLLKETKLPARVSSKARKGTIRDRMEDLVEILSEQQELIEGSPKLSQTAIAKHFVSILQDCVKQVESLLEKSLERKALGKQFNSILAEIRLELNRGISLTARKGKDGEPLSPFTEREIREIDKAFAAIPRITTYPYFKGVEKTRQFRDRNSIGFWDDGRIDVSEATFTDRDHSKEFSLKKPAGPALAHELGHALQLGLKDGAEFRFDLNRGFLGRIVGNSDPIFPLREFLQIGGWYVVNPKVTKLVDRGNAILFEGRRFNINQEFKLDGTRFVFCPDPESETIFCRRSKGELCGRTYGASTPYEHAADSVVFYLYNPDAMIRDSPKLFALFDKHFRVYRDDVALTKKLTERLSEVYPRERNELFIERRVSIGLAGRITINEGESNSNPAVEAITERRKFRIHTHPGMSLASFLLSRFERFTPEEQQKSLSLMLAAETAQWSAKKKCSGTDSISDDPARRYAQFKRLASLERLEPAAISVVSHVLEGYNPAILPLIEAHLKGDDVGVITRRGNRDGHSQMISALEDFLGFKIKTQYFLGDSSLNMRLRKLGILEEDQRKAQIAKEFLGGSYVNIDGESVPMQPYRGIVLLEDDSNSYDTLKLLRRQPGGERFFPLLVSKLPHSVSMDRVVSTLREFKPSPSGEPKRLVMSSLDGALINVHAVIYARYRESSDVVATFTPEEWNELRVGDRWKDEIRKFHPKIAADSIWIDREDFSLPDSIARQIQTPEIFKQRKFQDNVPRGRIIEAS